MATYNLPSFFTSEIKSSNLDSELVIENETSIQTLSLEETTPSNIYTLTQEEYEELIQKSFNQGLVVGLAQSNAPFVMEVDYTRSLVTDSKMVRVLVGDVVRGSVMDAKIVLKEV